MSGRQDVSRRQFVVSSAAAAVAPLILSRASFAVPRRAPANDRVAVGLIGTGKRMFEMIGPFLEHAEFQVVAVCDVDTTRRAHAKKLVEEHYAKQTPSGEYKGCAEFVDYREMLPIEGLDAVVIATPDHWHANPCLDSAAAGKDIYCDKPLTHKLAEGQRLIEAVRRHKRVFQTGSQQRTEYDHKFVTACELVRNGRIGKVLTVHVGVGDPPKPCDLPEEPAEPGLDWDRWLGPAPVRPYHSELSPRGVHSHYPAWRRYSEYCGGYLADMGAHHFDIAQWGLARDDSGPVRIEPPKDEAAMRGATMLYADGARLVHGGPGGTTFIGTDGVIAVDRGRLHSVPENLLTDPLPEGAQRLPRHANHIQNWLDCIKSRETPVCDVEVGARSAAVCQLAILAYELRRPLTWDPAAWTFPGDLEANARLDYERRPGYELPKV